MKLRVFFAALLITAGPACALTINLNFSGEGWGEPDENFNGNLGAAPDDLANTFWTDTNANSQDDMVASDGFTPTTIGFSLTGDVANDIGWNLNDTALDIFERGFGNFRAASIGDPGILTISGLDDGTAYDLYIYSGVYNNGNWHDGQYTAGGTTLIVTGEHDGGSFEEGNNYVKFSGLSPSNSQIVVDLENYQSASIITWAVVAFQITDELVAPIPDVAPATGAVVSNFVGVSFNSESSKTYMQESSTDGTNWVETGISAEGVDEVLTLFDPTGPSPSKTYRVVTPTFE